MNSSILFFAQHVSVEEAILYCFIIFVVMLNICNKEFNWTTFNQSVIPQTTFHQVAAFTAIFCGVLGPGIVLMLTRERPLSEH